MVALALAAVAAVAGASCARRTAGDKAAERAQDACIAALGPVGKSHAPSPAVLTEAVADARAAASVDPGRWRPLRVRVEALAGAYGTDGFEGAVGDLVTECRRVNEIVRNGGKAPAGA